MIVQCNLAKPQALEIKHHVQGYPALSRESAVLRLQTLVPGTQEHSLLQNTLLKTAGIAEICLPEFSYRVNTSVESCYLLGGFGSSEHRYIGEAVQLKGLPDGKTPLLLKGGIPIRFRDVIPLAGDFYGKPGKAISLLGGNDEEKTARFLENYETLEKADPVQIQKIISIIDHESHAVEHSALPHHCYSSQMIGNSKAIGKIKQDIGDLLVDNSDHFYKDAREAYRVGHAYALKIAGKAGGNIEELKRAYAVDAYACHFLTDLFSAGHMRNQRGELEIFLVSVLKFPAYAKEFAGILTGAQHEKDGDEGLNVSNGRDSWRAYGDGSFFAQKNGENKTKVIAATQASVDEVYAAYCAGDVPHSSSMDQHIPFVTEFNPPPLYTVDGTSLVLNDRHKILKIETCRDYVWKGIPHAIKYLPEEYVNGGINGLVQKFLKINLDLNIDSPVFTKVFVPRFDRITGGIWRVIGYASHHHLVQGHNQINVKIDEMASVIKEAFDMGQKTQKKMEEINSKLDELRLSNLLRDVNKCVSIVKDEMHRMENFKRDHEGPRIVSINDELKHVIVRMSRIFLDDHAEGGKKLLAVYQAMLSESSSSSAAELKIILTLWFRQILEYQEQAFNLSKYLEIISQANGQALGVKTSRDFQLDVFEFEDLIKRQIEYNQDFIDGTLIDKPNAYIMLQIEKCKLIRMASNKFN